MKITDLIAGLAFVNAHVGLYRLDKGLRDGLAVPMEQLQAHVQMVTRSAQVVTITNQIQQLKGQAGKFEKQKLNAQHAQLMVQISQLQLQLQQVQAERQHLELEVKREQRLAQENRILKIFVDMYDQALTYRQQGQLLNQLVVTLATLRIYRQIYNDLDDANNRIRISDLKERLYQGVRELLESPEGRQRLADQYVEAIRYPLQLTQRGSAVGNNARTAVAEEAALRQTPLDGNWPARLIAVDETIAFLESVKNALATTRAEYIEFAKDLDPSELFFPVMGGTADTLVGGMNGAWAAWVSTIETSTNRPLAQISTAIQAHPPLFDQDAKAMEVATDDAKQIRLTNQIGFAATSLAQAAPAYQARFQQLQELMKQLAGQVGSSDVTQILDAFAGLQQIRQSLPAEFSGLRSYIKANGQIADGRYLTAASKRLQAIQAGEEVVPITVISTLTGIDQSAGRMEGEIINTIRTCEGALNKAVETDDTYQRLQEHARALLPQATMQEVEARTASYQPSGVSKVFSAFRSDRSKDIERRRYVTQALAEACTKARVPTVTELPDLKTMPPFPVLPETRGFFGG
jgi:hypothetical protein